MKTVGKQLQEARLAKNWTPELAARETKIKVDRLHDLEADDYSHFTGPAYARGFVRTYARFLGLDEYRILRQLDHKLPDDDTPTITTESGIPYLPETSMPPRVAHRNYAGLYILMALGCLVSLVIAFVLLEAYRVGDLQRYFSRTPNPEAVTTDTGAGTNGAPASPGAASTDRALPLDSNTPPPIDATDTTHSLRALPVDPAALAPATTNSAPDSDAPLHARRALPVDPSELTNAPPNEPPPGSPSANTEVHAPLRALPVTAADLAAAASSAPSPSPAPADAAPVAPSASPSLSARQSDAVPIATPSVTVPPATTNAPPVGAAPDKRLVLTASQDSFVRVMALDGSDTNKPLYAAVLHSGQSVGFDGRKFSINVGIPAAVDIRLDGVNYGPHSDKETPETFTVESHQP